MIIEDNTQALVIGGGFAGVEAAWALAEAGVRVSLAEMRPVKMTPAHKTGDLAELVCSNSFKSDAPAAASHLLKEEMRRMGSITMRGAETSKVPAGAALAVDRDTFAHFITDAIEGHPNITLIRGEITEPPAGLPTIIATGPLTSDALSAYIATRIGTDYLYFHDAIAPTIEADSIDLDRVYHASRYDKGDGGYLNCAMTQDEYYTFLDALLAAERVEGHDFENMHVFEGCMPIEEMASRGRETLTFGPLKPVGLNDPRTGKRAYAVAQLRQENLAATLYGLVGFQTRLKFPEQKRVFRMLPGLENAEFAQYGAMHRNTYVNSPRVLDATLRFVGPHEREGGNGDLSGILSPRPSVPGPQAPAVSQQPSVLYFAGQIVGVEGYVESAATGIVAGRALAAQLKGESFRPLPPQTILGALCRYVAFSDPENFQPMNACFGILPPSGLKAKKLVRHAAMVERGIAAMERYLRGRE
ncbi:MAG TPA: methylenetetrahydrofolate--tRNA-(uracil(54)-C(5))-methyltransferase (FADH(2)-oxidizing) TrmFO [Armatimonadota bacterium]